MHYTDRHPFSGKVLKYLAASRRTGSLRDGACPSRLALPHLAERPANNLGINVVFLDSISHQVQRRSLQRL